MSEALGREKYRLGPDATAETATWIVWLARFVLRVFFRKTEISGLDRVPTDGPIVFVSNHINGLLDPALLLAYMPRRPRFLGKSTLWKIPLVRPFLGPAAAIPVYRRQDPGVDTTKNSETFSRCHEVLAAGGAIALFPEGRSHSEPAVVPLKTGVSRIVLEAERRFGGLGVKIVPVGLTFDDKAKFRSRVLMRVGDFIEAAPELGAYGEEESRTAVASLTERVRRAIQTVTLNFPSWDEAHLIDRAAELFQRPHSTLPAEADLGERFKVRKMFIAGYGRLKERLPERVGEAAEAVRRYDELLGIYRLSDRQVASSYPVGGVLRFLIWSLGLLFFRLPFAVLGTVANAFPYQLAGILGRRLGGKEDQIATYKLFASLVLYPLTWLAIGTAVGWRWGAWPWGIGAALVAPLSGYVALRFHERRGFFAREVRAYFLLRSGGRGIEELRRLRGRVAEAVGQLATEYLASTEATQKSHSPSGQSSPPTLDVQ